MKKLRNTFSVFVIFLFVFALNFNVNITQGSVNSGLRIGDECSFNETSEGVCAKINKCDYITENAEFRKRIPDEIKKSLCLSRERQQLVCCPSLKPQDIRMNESKFEKATCVNQEPQYTLGQNIIDGEYAGVGEFQFHAAIGYKAYGSNLNNEYLYSCSGSLIADDIVITSAYCLRRSGLKLSVVKIGATSLINDPEDYSESEDIEIETSVPHPGYSWHTGANNIALIKLKRPYNQTSWSITPICLSTNDENIPDNFTITGYGMNFGQAETRSDWLLRGTSVIHPHSLFKDTQIRVEGYNGTETCFGDFGGPLIYDIHFVKGTLTYLYGIKSVGFSCESSKPSIYTKVSSYIKWIKNTMESLEKNNDPVFWS